MGLTRINSQDITDGQVLKGDLGVLSGKGSLVSYDGSQHVELGSGQSGYILSVDPSSSAGLNWIAPPTSGPGGVDTTTGFNVYGILGISGGVESRYVRVTGNYTALSTDYTIVYNSIFSGTNTITLPATSAASGQILWIQNESTGFSGMLCITGNSVSDRIDECSAIYIRPGDRLCLISEGDGDWDSLVKQVATFGITPRGKFGTERRYTSPCNGAALATAALVNTRIYAMPFIVDRTMTITGMGVNVTATGVPNTTGSPVNTYVKAAIYNDDGSMGPGLLYQNSQTNEIPTNVIAIKFAGFTDGRERVLSRGLYWLALACSGATNPGTIRGFAVTGPTLICGHDIGLGTASSIFGYLVLNTVASGASFPGAFPTNLTTITAVPIPAIFVAAKNT